MHFIHENYMYIIFLYVNGVFWCTPEHCFLKVSATAITVKNCYALTSLSFYGVGEGQKNCFFEMLYFGGF